ncbi:hypothetical protein [Mycobacterium sp.]|uniref:hypothetical protein n=1 Tax=Mycobacterium sp. TaxID=1785 RepID=UPI003D1104D1
MSFVLVEGAIIGCSHGGQLTLGSGDARLSVDGNGAITFGMEAGLSFAAAHPPCTNKTTTTPPPAPQPAPCVTSAATAGQSTKLSVGNLPVLLDSANGPTVPALLPAAPGTWNVVSAGQAKLEAM